MKVKSIVNERFLRNIDKNYIWEVKIMSWSTQSSGGPWKWFCQRRGTVHQYPRVSGNTKTPEEALKAILKTIEDNENKTNTR